MTDLQDYSPKQIQSLLKKIRQDPSFFAKEVLGIDLWQKQKEILYSVRDYPNTVVRSGHGVGKTTTASVAVLWFLTAFHPSRVITTAPTWLQVKSVLWAEINRLYKNSKIHIGGEMLQTAYKLTEEHFAVGFSTDDPDKFQGHHSPNIFVVFDEAPGVRADVWEASKGLLSSENAKFLGIGNPTTPVGPFYDAFKSANYKKMAISCFDAPNVVQDKIVVPGLVTKKWIEERKNEWGENSPIYKSRVLGEFPTEGEDTLIPLTWIEKCVEIEVEESEEDKIVLGNDVARYGGDHTAFTIMDGKKQVHLEGYQGKDTTKTVGRGIQLHNKYKCEKILVDDTGVGGGVTDMLDEQGYPVEPVNFGSSPHDTDRFYNLKAEIYWNLREAFENREISIFKNDRLIEELASLMYEVTSKGKLKIVSKDKMKKMGIKSPDYADSLVIAHYGSYSSRRGILDFYKEQSKEVENAQKQSNQSFLNRTVNKANFIELDTSTSETA